MSKIEHNLEIAIMLNDELIDVTFEAGDDCESIAEFFLEILAHGSEGREQICRLCVEALLKAKIHADMNKYQSETDGRLQ